MTDIFTRLTSRAFDMPTEIHPVITSRFAPGAIALNEKSSDYIHQQKSNTRVVNKPAFERESFTGSGNHISYEKNSSITPYSTSDQNVVELAKPLKPENESVNITLGRSIADQLPESVAGDSLNALNVEEPKMVQITLQSIPAVADNITAIPQSVTVSHPSDHDGFYVSEDKVEYAAPASGTIMKRASHSPMNFSNKEERRALEEAPDTSLDQFSEPTIRVNIGRIEIRAIQQPAASIKKTLPRIPKLTLNEYLRQRNEGKR